MKTLAHRSPMADSKKDSGSPASRFAGRTAGAAPMPSLLAERVTSSSQARAPLVLQQQPGDALIRRQDCPSPRAPDEERQSATTGFVDPDVVLTLPQGRLEVFDFAVGSATLPRGATDHPDWQRAMSIMAGDPNIRVGVQGFTDCVGTQTENFDLRERRVASVMAALPEIVRSRVLFSFTLTTREFVDPSNATPEARARNRSVRITYLSMPPGGSDPCDSVPRARTIDEFLFLVRCMESRLGLTSPADAPQALSVLRQIYYGSSPWTFRGGRDPLWAMVIPTRPWPAGTDPSTRLGPVLGALHQSQTVEGMDIGHILAGIDAMMAPSPVEIPLGRVAWVSGVPREEWATWVGDIGAAAADWAIDVLVRGAEQTPATLDARFAGHARDVDLAGDINAFAMRAGLSGGAAAASTVGAPLRLTGTTLSDALMQYFRITSSGPGRARAHAAEVFVQAYGGTLSGGRIANPAAFEARLRPTVHEFAFYYMMQGLVREQYFARDHPPTVPDPAALLDFAVTEMTRRFMRWLEAHP